MNILKRCIIYLLAAIMTIYGLIAFAFMQFHPKLIFVFMFCIFCAYKLLAYANKKYSKKPAKW